MKNKLKYNTLTAVLLQFVTLLSGFILPRLYLTQYGSEVNGLCQSITQFLGLISFMEMGVGQVVKSALYKPLAEGDQHKISSVVASGNSYFRKIAYVLIVYIFVLSILYPFVVSTAFDWTFIVTLIASMAISNFAQYYFCIMDGVILSADQCGYIQDTIKIVTTLLNVILCTLLIKLNCSIQLVKFFSSVVYLVRPILLRAYVNKKYSINRRTRYNPQVLSQKWNGIAQHVSAVVLESTDNVVLTIFSTLTNVSVYSVYYLVIAGIVQLYTSLTSGLQALLGRLWAERDMKRLTVFFGGMEIVLHSITVFLFSCVMTLTVPFVRVYTDGIPNAEYIQPTFAVILATAYAVRCLRTPYNMVILAAGHFKQTQHCHIITAAVNLLLSVVCVRKWGLLGVAIGTLVAMVYQTIWMAFYVSKKLIGRSFVCFVRYIVIDSVAFVLIWIASRWIALSTVSYVGWFLMALKGASVALVIVVLGMVFPFRKSVKMMIREISE